MIWRGLIYSASVHDIMLRALIISHGIFASGWFETLYTSPPAGLLGFFSSLEYHVLVTLPLAVLSATFHWVIPLALTSLAVSLGVCIAAGGAAGLPRKKRGNRAGARGGLLFPLPPVSRARGTLRGLPG